MKKALTHYSKDFQDNYNTSQAAIYPDFLKTKKRWLLFRLGQPDARGKQPKYPYYSSGTMRKGQQGSEDDLNRLCSFDEALAGVKSGRFDGIGYAIITGDGVACIDIDYNCPEDTKAEIVKRFPSYTEKSLSGKGLHIWLNRDCKTFKDNGLGVEVFGSSQFVAMTGDIQTEITDAIPANDEAFVWLENLIKPKAAAKDKTKIQPAQKPRPISNATDELSKIENALSYISPDCGHDLWYKLGAAIYNALGASGFSVWDRWSSQSSLYKQNEMQSKYNSFARLSDITAATLFKHAIDGGWKPPRQEAEKQEKENYAGSNNIYSLADIKYKSKDKAEHDLEQLGTEQDPFKCAQLAYSYAIKCLPKIPCRMSFKHLESVLRRNAGDKIHEDTMGVILGIVEWILKQSKKQALESISIQNAGDHNHIILNDFDQFKPEYKGVYLIKAGTGIGKTQKVGVPFADWCKYEGHTFLAVAHLRSLIKELSKRLETEHYEEEKETYRLGRKKGMETQASIDSLSVCLPSFLNEAYSKFMSNVRYVFIDEITQVLAIFKTEKIFKSTDVEQVFLFFKEKIAKAECLIVADANINQDTLEFLEECRPNERFNIVEIAPKDEGKEVTIYQSKADLVEKIICDIKQENKKVWIACDSANEAKKLQRVFSNYHAINSIAIVGSLHKVKGTKEFIANIENESKKYQVVIASPAIMSGVSVEHKDSNGVTQPYFDYVAFILCGKTVSSSDAHQMGGRIRYAKEFHLFAEHKHVEHMSFEDAMAGKEIAAQLEDSKAEITPFTRHIEKLIYRKAKDEGNFSNNLYYLLEHYLFSFKPAEYANSTATRALIKQAGSEISTEKRIGILNAQVITDDQAQKLERADYLDEPEHYALQAYQRRMYLNLPFDAVLTEADLEINMAQIVRYRAFRDGYEQSKDKHKDLTLRTYAEATAKLYKTAFDCMQVVGGAAYGNDEAIKILDAIEPYRMTMAAIGAIPKRFGNEKYKRDSYAVRDLKRILEYIGIESNNRRSNTVSGHMPHNLYINSRGSVPIQAEIKGEKINTINADALQKMDYLIERHLVCQPQRIESVPTIKQIPVKTIQVPPLAACTPLLSMNDDTYAAIEIRAGIG